MLFPQYANVSEKHAASILSSGLETEEENFRKHRYYPTTRCHIMEEYNVAVDCSSTPHVWWVVGYNFALDTVCS